MSRFPRTLLTITTTHLNDWPVQMGTLPKGLCGPISSVEKYLSCLVAGDHYSGLSIASPPNIIKTPLHCFTYPQIHI